MSARKYHLRMFQIPGWGSREVWQVKCGALWVSNSVSESKFRELPQSMSCANCRKQLAKDDGEP